LRPSLHPRCENIRDQGLRHSDRGGNRPHGDLKFSYPPSVADLPFWTRMTAKVSKSILRLQACVDRTVRLPQDTYAILEQ
jgi:hypothetical protein